MIRICITFCLALAFSISSAQNWEWVRKVDSTVFDYGLTYDVHFANRDTALVVWRNTQNSELRRTTDQGLTWSGSLLNVGGYPEVEYAGAGAFLLAEGSGRIYRSADWGDTWTVVHQLPANPTALLGHFQMWDSLSGYYTGYFFSAGQAVSNYDSAFVLLTIDGGLNWDYHRIPGNYPGQLRKAGNGLWWGSSMYRTNTGAPLDSTFVIFSGDQGQTWGMLDPASSVSQGVVDVVPAAAPYFTDDSTGFWFPGYYLPYLHRSTDGGQTWRYDSTWFANAAIIQEVYFASDSMGIALSGPTDPTGYYFYRTWDAGNTWETGFGYEFPCFGAAYGYQFYSDSVLYLSGLPGIAKVTDFMGDSTACPWVPLPISNPDPVGLKIHPNPAQDLVRLTWPMQMDALELQLLNAHGKPLRKFSFHEPQNTLDCEISKLEAGLYFFALKSASGIHTIRFVKQ